ncbi:Hypothetical protein SMAX5B_016728 [Scophthalmus maximus]|uniref:Uncharacterized protein n=1 Tax=Scophthalmus maximus TaxID=52904 RepID=A0A2U9B307_SCOMX|nr:Hypothetical protein SMAX5B_016728 [Scophthalmus maximus]
MALSDADVQKQVMRRFNLQHDSVRPWNDRRKLCDASLSHCFAEKCFSTLPFESDMSVCRGGMTLRERESCSLSWRPDEHKQKLNMKQYVTGGLYWRRVGGV